MISIKNIQSVIQPLVHDYKPEQIILFGSYAGGSPMEDEGIKSKKKNPNYDAVCILVKSLIMKLR